MCGIAGIFHYGDPGHTADRDVLVQMTRALAHRGPDGEGIFVDGPLGLGHRRLAIVDLSPTGAQPMALEGTGQWLAYNGEFYNHRGFRPALETRYGPFRGTSDTETLLRLLAHRGPDVLAEVAGIFALAWWDRPRRRLTLARDPLGVKQLYFHDDGRRIVFASEIKAVLACPDVPRSVDPEAVNQYLQFHTPLFERTFLRDVRQVRAGESIQITATGSTRRRYWSVDDFIHRGGTDNDNVRDLQDRLGAVVSEQLMADVPVGAFFSGGIDSSAVASFASRAGAPPVCFGVHFTGQGVVDERPYQEAAAKALGLELELTTLDGQSFPEDLQRLLYFQDQPVIGSAMLPMYYVARLAARRVKVCVGGQAADEIFGGYARYALVHPGKVLRSWRPRGRTAQAVATGGPAAPAAVGGNLVKQLTERKTLDRIVRNLRQGVRAVGDWRERYFANFAKVPEATWRQVFSGHEFVSRDRARGIYHATLAASAATDPADKVMHWDMQTYLTGLFQQDDRMSMANSLESRVPFADPRLVRYAFTLGFDRKFRAGASKWLLRKAVSDVIPGEVLNRRKVGFDTPAEAWMRGPHKDFVRDTLLSSAARSRGIWNPRGLSAALDRTDDPLWFDVIWKALCIETWATLTLDRKVPSPAAP